MHNPYASRAHVVCTCRGQVSLTSVTRAAPLRCMAMHACCMCHRASCQLNQSTPELLSVQATASSPHVLTQTLNPKPVIDLLQRCSDAERLGGCVVVSAALLEEALPPLAAGAPASPASGPDPAPGGAAGTPVLLTYGERDADLAPAVLASAAALRRAGELCIRAQFLHSQLH